MITAANNSNTSPRPFRLGWLIFAALSLFLAGFVHVQDGRLETAQTRLQLARGEASRLRAITTRQLVTGSVAAKIAGLPNGGEVLRQLAQKGVAIDPNEENRMYVAELRRDRAPQQTIREAERIWGIVADAQDSTE